ncbi:hypothetical protein L4P89_004231 [Pseudomonas aeruginosa]|nr:hypothetical protein [Pseudomonas aeruginosa]
MKVKVPMPSVAMKPRGATEVRVLAWAITPVRLPRRSYSGMRSKYRQQGCRMVVRPEQRQGLDALAGLDDQLVVLFDAGTEGGGSREFFWPNRGVISSV